MSYTQAYFSYDIPHGVITDPRQYNVSAPLCINFFEHPCHVLPERLHGLDTFFVV